MIRIIYDHNWVIRYIIIQNGCLKIVQLPNIHQTSHKVQLQWHLHNSVHNGLDIFYLHSYDQHFMDYNHTNNLFLLNPRWPIFRFYGRHCDSMNNYHINLIKVSFYRFVNILNHLKQMRNLNNIVFNHFIVYFKCKRNILIYLWVPFSKWRRTF